MRRCVQAKVSVTTHSPASRGLQKGDFLQVLLVLYKHDIPSSGPQGVSQELCLPSLGPGSLWRQMRES